MGADGGVRKAEGLRSGDSVFGNSALASVGARCSHPAIADGTPVAGEGVTTDSCTVR